MFWRGNWSDQFFLRDEEGEVTENPNEEAILEYAQSLINEAKESNCWDLYGPDEMSELWELEEGTAIEVYYLGSFIAPSGKYYMPWTTNQTTGDVEADTIFWEELDRLAGELDWWAEGGEGDPTDTFLFRIVELDDEEELD